MNDKVETFIKFNEFYKSYKKDMMNRLELIYPEKSDEELSEMIDDKVKESFSDKVVTLENTQKGTIVKDLLSKKLDFIEREKPVLTGNGFLMRQDEFVIEKMLKHLLALRKEYKKEMFKYLNTDKEKSTTYKQWQNTVKELTNSYYGAMGEPNSQFFDKFLVPAVTQSGQNIIATAIIGYESFFGNAALESIDDLLLYVRRILDEYDDLCEAEEIGELASEVINAETISDEELKQHLFKLIPYEKVTQKNTNVINNLIGNMTKEEKFFILMKNNFFKFIENPYIKDMLSEVKDYDYKDFDKFINLIDDEKNDRLDESKLEDPDAFYLISDFWYLLETFVAYYHTAHNSKWKINNEKRNTILIVDTDSTFIYLGPVWDFFENNYNLSKDNSNLVTSVVNFMVVICSLFIKELFAEFTKNVNIPENVRDYTAMKNEFLIERLILTKNKKQYAAKITSIEGKILDKPDISLKGLQLKKSSVAKETQRFFKELIEEEIMAKEIDLVSLFNKIRTFEEFIKRELKEGKPTFAKIASFKDMRSYVDPYTQQVVRGSILWNLLNPSNTIQPGIKCGIYKLHPTSSLEELEKRVDLKTFEILKEKFFSIENLAKFQMDVIAFPLDGSKPPSFLIDLIKSEEIISDNIRNGLVLLKSLGLKDLDIKQSSFLSNILEL